MDEQRRHARAEELFARLCELRAEEQRAALARELGGDPALERYVAELLAVDQAARPRRGAGPPAPAATPGPDAALPVRGTTRGNDGGSGGERAPRDAPPGGGAC